jgi:hypothetical protein
MVAKYVPPDSTAQDWATWRSGLDGAVVAGARIDQAFLPQAQDTPNMTVRVLAGALLNGTTLTEVAAQNTGTIVAPVTHPRIDRVVLNPATGAIQVVTGTEAASPVAPAIPAERLPLCRFQLATGTAAISNPMIVDERVGTGGGGTASDDSFVDVASATTLDLGAQTSRSLRVTGTTAISSFGATTPTARKRWTLRFAAALTLTHNATSLILPSGASIVTAAGDVCEVAWIGGTNFVVFDYTRADGRALVATSSGAGFGDGADGALNTAGNVNLTTSTGVDDTGIVVRNYTTITINSGHTVTAAIRARIMVLRCTGNVVINGTLSMNARGAAATPSGAFNLTRNVADALVTSEVAATVFTVALAGGTGGTAGAASVGGTGGTATNGTGGGGGGGGVAGGGGNGGAGAAGTVWCGGSAGGGGSGAGTGSVGGAGATNGGAGGNGFNDGGGLQGGGGAGNPVGSSGGTAATGGGGGTLIIIAAGTVTIGATGVVSANGGAGGNASGGLNASGGGGAGGGRIIILSAGAYSNSGTVQANGGLGGSAVGANGRAGGPGGAGAITQQIIAP